LSNAIPVLNDANLASRFIYVAFPVSFRDREDVTIFDKLKVELPGIANRCLAAYRRLCERGRFIQPQSGLDLAKEISRGTYPFAAFMEDIMVLDRNGEVRPIVMLCRLHEWCVDNKETDLLKRITTPSHLSKALKEWIQRENIQGLNTKTFRGHGDDRVWIGLRLKTQAERRGKPEIKLVEPVAAKAEVKVARFLRRF
jgi:phage/plasmid-associated DNA primase